MKTFSCRTIFDVSFPELKLITTAYDVLTNDSDREKSTEQNHELQNMKSET